MKKKTVRPALIRFGIVGGGQLARMLALEAANLGLQIHVLSESADDPAAQVVQHWKKGSPSSYKDLFEFSENLNLLTFESEFFDMQPYQQITKDLPVYIFPNPDLMLQLQDRQHQKNLLLQHHLPTSKFIMVSDRSSLADAFIQFPKGFVLKKCRGGYDGTGTYYCKSKKDIEKLNSLFPAQFIAEEFIDFKRELAVIATRSRDGSCELLPLVETFQENSRCDWVAGPVTHKKFFDLSKKIKKFLQETEYVGSIGFELFDTGNDLLINEVAPRVHNSGHYSQQALPQSQFLLHIHAGLGEKIVKPIPLAKSFCMVNLIGKSQNEVFVPLNLSGQLHWYAKKQNRIGRKIGHINYLGNSKKSLLKKARAERKKFCL